MISKINLIPLTGLTLCCHSCSLDNWILAVVLVEWLNTGGAKGEKIPDADASGILAKAVSSDRQVQRFRKKEGAFVGEPPLWGAVLWRSP